MHNHSSDCKVIVDESGWADANLCMHPRTPQLLEKTVSSPRCAVLQHLYQALPRHPAHIPGADSSKARPSLSAQQGTDANLRLQKHLSEHSCGKWIPSVLSSEVLISLCADSMSRRPGYQRVGPPVINTAARPEVVRLASKLVRRVRSNIRPATPSIGMSQNVRNVLSQGEAGAACCSQDQGFYRSK